MEQKGLAPEAADAIGRYVRDDVEPKFQGQPQEVSLSSGRTLCGYEVSHTVDVPLVEACQFEHMKVLCLLQTL